MLPLGLGGISAQTHRGLIVMVGMSSTTVEYLARMCLIPVR